MISVVGRGFRIGGDGFDIRRRKVRGGVGAVNGAGIGSISVAGRIVGIACGVGFGQLQSCFEGVKVAFAAAVSSFGLGAGKRGDYKAGEDADDGDDD